MQKKDGSRVYTSKSTVKDMYRLSSVKPEMVSFRKYAIIIWEKVARGNNEGGKVWKRENCIRDCG